MTCTFLYYARAVDATMLFALSAIASEQAAPTEQTMKKTRNFLGYVALQPDTILTFSASNMVLNVHSNASCLTELKAQSRAGDHFFLSNNSKDPIDNGAVLNVAKMKIESFPEDLIEHYKLCKKVDENGLLFIRVEQGMYGLPHAGIIAQKLLEERLTKHRYRQSDHTPGLWIHDWRPISFSIIVDDFGVKYVGREHADHLIKILEEFYVVDKDWEGKNTAESHWILTTTHVRYTYS